VAKNAARVPNPLVKRRGGVVRVVGHSHQQGMSAPDTGVLVVIGTQAGAGVGVMAKEATQHVSRTGDPSVLEEKLITAPSAPRALVCPGRAEVDLVSEEAARPAVWRGPGPSGEASLTLLAHSLSMAAGAAVHIGAGARPCGPAADTGVDHAMTDIGR